MLSCFKNDVAAVLKMVCRGQGWKQRGDQIDPRLGATAMSKPEILVVVLA